MPEPTPFNIELRLPARDSTSVPHTLKAARAYAGRLEQRFYGDQRRTIRAVRHLDIAHSALTDALISRRPCSRLDLAIALGEIDIAREALLIS